MNSTALHQPVLLSTTLQMLEIKPEAWYVDATFGRGGHTQEILAKQGRVIAFDVDQEAIAYAQESFNQEIKDRRLILIKSNFANLGTELKNLQSRQAETIAIHGILFDFGTSLDQIRAPHRGFSFDHPDAPLDMRMDQELGITASDLLTVLSVKQLSALFKDYGGEEHAKKIAQAIDRYRGKTRSNRIETVGQLLDIAFKNEPRKSHLHPATKVLQALRIAVNDELSSIEQALPQAFKVLAENGRIVTIAFHQGEDVIVKNQFKEWEDQELGEILTKKPVTADEEELAKNPQSRSAKLRVFKKN